jgi:hypothetical protein
VSSLDYLLALVALNTMLSGTFEAKMLLQYLLHISDPTFDCVNIAGCAHEFDLALAIGLMPLGIIKSEDGLALFIVTLKFGFV